MLWLALFSGVPLPLSRRTCKLGPSIHRLHVVETQRRRVLYLGRNLTRRGPESPGL